MDVSGLQLDSFWSYVVGALVVAAEGLFPIVPGETVLIGGAVLSARGEASLAGVLVATAIGGLVGDQLSYWVGRTAGRSASGRFLRGPRARAKLADAASLIEKRGRTVVVLGRFVPNGRTATTFACGALGMPWRRFAGADLLAVLLWTVIAGGAGFQGGATLGTSAPLAIAATLLVLLLISAAGGRIARRRRIRRAAAEAT